MGNGRHRRTPRVVVAGGGLAGPACASAPATATAPSRTGTSRAATPRTRGSAVCCRRASCDCGRPPPGAPARTPSGTLRLTDPTRPPREAGSLLPGRPGRPTGPTE